ncbi:hypothetical protein DPMN_030081 [Dreissena polymorpha]|uniref:Uncharacterized protein n=1 Tax=Dreissena polymorpha TaxID=45954 RepID=A0A9D4RHQ5_DREPO|nr:hypothetical protein DPMN_030081 [Dreissena polymorpha]
MQSLALKINPDQVMTVKRKYEYYVSISSDRSQRKPCSIVGICNLPYGQVIVLDYTNYRLKLLDEQFNVTSCCDVLGNPTDICQVTSNEVTVTSGYGVVMFMSVINWQLVNGRKFQLQHDALGIVHHQGSLYININIPNIKLCLQK